MIERDQSAASRFSLSLEDWRTLQAAIDRIVPSDNDPGAEQTGVADFITGFLAGPDRVHARADGRGFIPLTGVALEAWKQRIDGVRTAYRTGLRRLRELARQTLESEFAELDAVSRDQVLRLLESEEGGTHAGKPPANQPVDTDALPFVAMLVAHVRQGYYGDPACGGNRDRAGWRTIGFDGPRSMADVAEGRYTTAPYLAEPVSTHRVWPCAHVLSARTPGPAERTARSASLVPAPAAAPLPRGWPKLASTWWC